jgi:predicted metal-dependent hydrolase
MSIFPQNFKEDVFTLEEIQNLKKLIKLGKTESLIAVLESGNDMEKEIEIQKLVNYLQPKTLGLEHRVSSVLQGIIIETPEQENKFQDLINEEVELISSKNKLINKKMELEADLSIVKADGKNTKDLISEINSEIEKIDKEYSKKFSVKSIQKRVDEILGKMEEIVKEPGPVVKEIEVNEEKITDAPIEVPIVESEETLVPENEIKVFNQKKRWGSLKK